MHRSKHQSVTVHKNIIFLVKILVILVVGIATPADLVCSLSHELFGWLSPDGGDCDDPPNVVVGDPCGRLIRQFLEAVVSEESQSVSKNVYCPQFLSIGRLDL